MANSEIQQKLFAIAHADWNTQYITADAEVKNKCYFGPVIRLLGIQNWPFVNRYFADPTSTIGAAQTVILGLIKASVTEIAATSEDRSDLHTSVAEKVNMLIDRFNHKTKRAKIDEATKWPLADFQNAPAVPVVPAASSQVTSSLVASDKKSDAEKQAEMPLALEPGEIVDPAPILSSPPVSVSRDGDSAVDALSSDANSVDHTETKRSRRKGNAERNMLRKAKKTETSKAAKQVLPKSDVDSSDKSEKSEMRTRSKKSKD